MPKKKGKPRVLEQEIQVSYSYTRRVSLVEKTCPICGKRFEGVKIRKFCGRACQQKDHYARHAKAYRALRMEGYYRQKKEAGKK